MNCPGIVNHSYQISGSIFPLLPLLLCNCLHSALSLHISLCTYYIFSNKEVWVWVFFKLVLLTFEGKGKIIIENTNKKIILLLQISDWTTFTKQTRKILLEAKIRSCFQKWSHLTLFPLFLLTLDKYKKKEGWGKGKMPDCAIALKGKLVLILGLLCFNERQEKLTMPSCDEDDCQSPLCSPCWLWFVNIIVKYLKPQAPSVGATNITCFLKIFVKIFFLHENLNFFSRGQ